jgi:hypothetical protein
MYSLYGDRSKLSQEAQKIIDAVGIDLDPNSKRSFTLVVFRIDPIDYYNYIIAHGGLIEPEPMFMPKFRRHGYVNTDGNNTNYKNPRGFHVREDIADDSDSVLYYVLGSEIDANPGVLWVSRRKEADIRQWYAVEASVLEQLNRCFSDFGERRKSQGLPLYPNIWTEERLALDKIRSRIRSLGISPPLSEVTNSICSSVVSSFRRFLNDEAILRTGLYLYTGDSWTIPVEFGEASFVPEIISATGRTGSRTYDYLTRCVISEDEHAFDWVHRSGKPVYLTNHMSPRWLERTKRCKLTIPDNGDVCIVPIRYDNDDAIVVGLLLVSIEKSYRFAPVHCFLTARIAQSVVGYMTRLFPASGFPWWPRAKAVKGRSVVIFDDNIKPSSLNLFAESQLVKDDVVEHIVKNMMPYHSEVRLTSLPPGLTGAAVYKMTIADEGKLIEIPRVLKIGDAEKLGDELLRYYRYVHNKPVGGQSRVDVAMCFPEIPWGVKDGDRTTRANSSTAAIVYTFVGMEADAMPIRWSWWAKQADREQLEYGIKKAMKYLSCWHLRGKETTKNLGDMLATRSEIIKQTQRAEYIKGDGVVERSLSCMMTIQNMAYIGDGHSSQSCIVHGDLHCDNIFAVIERDNNLLDIAIIDWGKVESDRHPATDIAVLLADLVFRVCCDRDDININWATEMLGDYAVEKGIKREESEVVFCFYLLKMLAWGPMEGQIPWIQNEYREKAIKYVEEKLDRVRRTSWSIGLRPKA